MTVLMPKNYLLSLITFVLFTSLIFAQNPEISCGTVTSPESIEYINSIKPQIEKFEKEFKTLSSLTRKGSTIMNFIPIKAHVIRKSNGTGGLNENDLNNAIANINVLYTKAYIEFFLCDDINYINNDAYYNFKRADEVTLTEENNVTGLINIYFTNYIEDSIENNVLDIGVCGYTRTENRADVIFMNNECAMNGSSLAHELGHFFSLIHTHGLDNNNLTTELVNGDNCDTDGDGICDTSADPQLTLNNVNGDCVYVGTATDANGDAFHPDTNNIMSYARKSCRTEFSPQQLARIFAFYKTSKNYLACSSFSVDFTTDINQTCDESLTVNFTNNSIDATSWEWDVDGDNIIDYTTQNPTHTYNQGIYDVTLIISNKSKTISKTFYNYIKVGTIETVLLNEDFEDIEIVGDKGWTTLNTSSNDYNWFINKGETPSDNTGPLLTNNIVNSYIYAEASGGQQGDVAEFISPCINVEYENTEIEFAYHMFGRNVGELHIDIKTKDGYINDVIPPLKGSQQQNQSDDFLIKNVNLSTYTNQTINIRFRAIRGISWDGDIAIDNVFIKTISTPISDAPVKVYPNPILGDIIYVKNNNFENPLTNFEISNLKGQVLNSGSLNNQSINVSNLNSGMYLLTLSNSKSKIVKKIIR